MTTKPFIKWAGGKTQIVNLIISKFPNQIDNYHEIFLGGGSVLIKLLECVDDGIITIKGRIIAYDINEILICCYRNIRDYPKEVYLTCINLVKTYYSIENKKVIRKPKNNKEAHTSQESYYYWIRRKFNLMDKDKKNDIIGTAFFIFLNKTCFRGLYREGPNGFNVPFGNYKNPEIINKQNLLNLSKLFKNVKFNFLPFDKSLSYVNKNDFVYLDPPYYPINPKSFLGYTKSGFSIEQHELLFKLIKKHNFLMSNSYTDFVMEKINKNNYEIEIIECKRTINSKNPESKVKEVLIKNLIL